MTTNDLDKNLVLCSANHRHYVRGFVIAQVEELFGKLLRIASCQKTVC